MAQALILETTFLVDLERETNRKLRGPAHQFLELHAESPLYLTFTIAGELASGLSLSERSAWEEYICRFHVIGFNLDVAWQYGTTYRYLQQNGLLIGTNDLWIAATALSQKLPLVTRNVNHFRRIPGLIVVEY